MSATITTPVATASASAAAATTTSLFGDTSKLPHDTKQPDIIASSIVTLFLSGCFVAARFYTRMSITRTRMGASEWLVLTAWIFSFGVTIPAILEAKYGMGAHFYDLGPNGYKASAIAETELFSILFYSLSLTFSKLSILVLYILVFSYSWVRTAGYGVLALVVASQVWVLYVIFTACTPLHAFWDMGVEGATCHGQAYWLANQYQLIATDFLVFALPLPVVWRLRVRPREKAMLVFVFALGFFTCTISIIRILVIIPLTEKPSADFTYTGVSAFYWTVVETNLAIVVASSLTLKPFVSRLLPSVLSSQPSDVPSPHQPGERHADANNAHNANANANSNSNSGGGSSRADRFGGRRGLFDPVLSTFASRISRISHASRTSRTSRTSRSIGLATLDDTQALHTRSGSQSTADLASDIAAVKSFSIRLDDEEMGYGGGDLRPPRKA